MAGLDKNYVGKVIRLQYTFNGNQRDVVGIVMEQKCISGNVSLNLLKLNGQTQEFDSRRASFDKISSVRLDKGVRDALEGLYSVKKAQKEFLDAFWKEKAEHERKVYAASRQLQEQTGELSYDEFTNAIEAFFSENFPTSDAFHQQLSFSVGHISDKEFWVCHNQDVVKYATPERFPFLYREYDQTLHIRYNDPSLRTFCSNHAPKEIPQLAGKVKNSVDVSLGDKNFLTVSRIYKFPLKYGMTRKSVAFVKEFVFEPVQSKASLDSMIGSATQKAKRNSFKTTSRNKQTERE